MPAAFVAVRGHAVAMPVMPPICHPPVLRLCEAIPLKEVKI